MLRTLAVAFAMLLSGATCLGQSSERVALYGGVSWLSQDTALINLNSSGPIGWDASATFPLRQRVGVVADFSGYYPSCGATCLSAKIHSFLVGPQISFDRGRVRPFVRFLFGDTYISPSAAITFTSSNSFTVGGGGGIDVSLNKRFALRGQVDWLHNGFTPSDNERHPVHNVARLSSGIVIRF